MVNDAIITIGMSIDSDSVITQYSTKINDESGY